MNPRASSPAIKVARSVREDVGEAEWAVRVDLAAFYRLVQVYGWTEGTANHISTSVPGKTNEFLINPYGLLYDEINASSLLRVDLDGEITYNATDYGVNVAGFVIHSAVHAARPDAFCVAHTHSIAGMAVSSMDCGLLPLAQTSMRFVHIGYHDFEGIAADLGERTRLVTDLGDHEAMILRNHGLLVAGGTVASAFNCLYRLERACETQVLAMNSNARLIEVPKDILEATYQKMRPKADRPNRNGDLVWPAMLRKLDRLDTSYKN